jgi:hypothetical protein
MMRRFRSGYDMLDNKDARPVRDQHLSLSQTPSGWQLIENRAMLSRNEEPLQAHWLDGHRSDPVAGSA